MIPNDYQEPVGFFVEKLERTQADTKILFESLRDEIRVVADGVASNGGRIDENTRSIQENSKARREYSKAR